ncbi:suppressor protein SRP40-like [Aphidius gifuensis]|uniref:suppressor protein SRP40-like n=1 Tax=Aphidius gifuensis TaxID=684658 RepID=UPI001CDD3710|nr:suppressor protein SRP40-like [Aphidius gifuensis]
MSYCDNKDKENYLNIDCNIVGINGHQENGPGDIYEVNRMKDVKVVVDSTPSAMEDEQTITAPSDNGNNQQINRLANVADKKKKMNDKKSWNSRKCGGNTSGGDDNHDVLSKKRKTRRGKPKPRNIKPYLKNTLYPRIRCHSNKQIKKSTQPPAPYNTTQFLMEDHSDLPEFEPKLAEGSGITTTTTTSSSSSSSLTTIPPSSQMTTTSLSSNVQELFQKPNPPPRTRDSSFSIDSEDDYFYSSPEDEEEFLTKEFSSAYEDLHAERLNSLSKHDLLQEYLLLESKLEHITKRMKLKNIQYDDDNNKTTTPTINTDDVGKKLKFYQQKIDDLLQQNDQLKRDNEALRGKRKNSVSSIDSESDSDDSSSSSSSTSNHSDNSACGDKDKSDFDKNLLEEDIHSDDTSTKDSSSPMHSNSIQQIKVIDGVAI